MPDKLFILKFLKFCLVGASGMIIDFGTTWLLKEKVHLNKYISNSSGFILAATSNYLFNRRWTFHNDDPHIVVQYSSFIGISLIGLAINNLVIYFLHGKLKYNFYISKLIAVVVVTIWNFGMNFLFTFR
jgi:putative flippase GtrA